MKTVESVNLERFMGDWYVIASIPTFIEKEAFNALESYRLASDGSISTTFTFNEGGFDGELKTYEPTGYIKDDDSNALWGMQFIWPFKADYRIVYLDEDYENTIIGRAARDYVWIMSRHPKITDDSFERLKSRVKDLGYDINKLQKVPQSWPSQGDPGDVTTGKGITS
jgi:apolipoprotein D and lipocalin family protein